MQGLTNVNEPSRTLPCIEFETIAQCFKQDNITPTNFMFKFIVCVSFVLYKDDYEMYCRSDCDIEFSIFRVVQTFPAFCSILNPLGQSDGYMRQ